MLLTLLLCSFSLGVHYATKCFTKFFFSFKNMKVRFFISNHLKFFIKFFCHRSFAFFETRTPRQGTLIKHLRYLVTAPCFQLTILQYIFRFDLFFLFLIVLISHLYLLLFSFSEFFTIPFLLLFPNNLRLNINSNNIELFLPKK